MSQILILAVARHLWRAKSATCGGFGYFFAAFFFFGALSSPSAAAGWGFFSRFGFGPLVGLAPSMRISEIRISVNSWRWPRRRREFLRRRFLKEITFSP